MNNLSGIKSTPAIVIALLLLAGCGSSDKKEEVFSPIGKWEYKVTTDVSYGHITISGSPGAYKAVMTTEVFGTLEVMNLVIQDVKLTGDLDVGGTPAKLKITFNGEKMTGAVSAGEDNFPMEGERASE